MKLRTAAHTAGYVALDAPVEISVGANDWGTVSRARDSKSRMCMVVVSRKARSAEDLLSHELDGQAEAAGRALGYPDCCVSRYAAFAASGDKWPVMLLEVSGAGPFSFWANRLALAWGGAAPTGQLFPCKLNCRAAGTFGKSLNAALRSSGIGKLADSIVFSAKTQVSICLRSGTVRRRRLLRPRRGWRTVTFQ